MDRSAREIPDEIDPTSVPGDFLRTTFSGQPAEQISRSIEESVWRDIYEVANEFGFTRATVLTAAAVVAVADFAGSREVSLAMVTGDGSCEAVERHSLSISLGDRDTLRSLTSRITTMIAGMPAALMPIAAGLTGPLVLFFGSAPPDPGLLTDTEIVITFQVHEDVGRLWGSYAPDLYESSTVRQLLNHIDSVVAVSVADPDQCIAGALRPTTADAVHFSAPEGPPPCPEDLFMPGDLIRTWMRSTPDAVAILEADGHVTTFRQLGTIATELAERLRRVADEGAPVAVLTSDSRTAAIVMVGCHFADLCFVVLDPEAPHTRATAMIEVTRCVVVVHDEQNRAIASLLATEARVPTVELDDIDLQAVGGGPRPGACEPRVADGSAAYIVFTSGTTGSPKGVVQPRQSLAQFISWQSRQLVLGPGSRVAMWSSPVFDACYMEVFGALGYGATLCIPPPGERRDPDAVAAWLSATQVTFFQGVPSFIEYIVAALEKDPRPMTALRNVIVAGEAFPPTLARRMRTVLGGARIHNMFGPTECVLATRYEVAIDHPENLRIPIGRPIAGRRVLLLDPGGRAVPKGAIGEIGIVSRFLSDGYVGDEPLTRERFRSLDDEDGEIVYLSGDFGRVAADGNLRYIGRRDAQVKVRGIRVNLDEVESVLSNQPTVRRCKIIDVPVGAGHKQLVAFVQSQTEFDASLPEYVFAESSRSAAWRRSIAMTLGDKVAPTRFILVRDIPRTATGKPDVVLMRAVSDALRTSTVKGMEQRLAGRSVSGLDRLVKSIVEETVGRDVQEDEDLLTGELGPMLMAVRLKKALVSRCPGVFDAVDLRVNPSVSLLRAWAHRGSAALDQDASNDERHLNK